jgi:hypothetical protein
MTVCVSLAVNDCIVFAADSASTLVTTDATTGASSVLNVYQHGDKVFNLYKGLPLVAMTCGMGNVGQASIGTLAKELRRRMQKGASEWILDRQNYKVIDVVRLARKLIFEERYSALSPLPPAPHSLEFFIGGYGSDYDSGHEVWKISIVDGNCSDPVPLVDAGRMGLHVGGQQEPIVRLVGGFDPALVDELMANGVKDSDAVAFAQQLRTKVEAALIWPTMPVQDAIDLASFLVDLTTKYFRFLPGADIVGGHTDLAVVTKYEGFKWIKRKHFYSPALNPLETDHA